MHPIQLLKYILRPSLDLKLRQVEVKQRDHGALRGEVSTITLHMEQKQEKERLARERVETLEVNKTCTFLLRSPGFRAPSRTEKRSTCTEKTARSLHDLTQEG